MSFIIRFAKVLTWLGVVLVSAALLACGDPPEPGASRALPLAGLFGNTYTETGDLAALRKRGIVRLIAPRFDEDEALPREGLPLGDYRRVAEDFVRSLGLTPQWVLVEDFSALDDALLRGRGDVIVTNLTRTATREDRFAFSVPLAVVNEVLILPAGDSRSSIEEPAPLTVTVPAGTSWAETVAQLAARYDHLTVQELSGGVSDMEMIDAVGRGQYQATVLDSDMASVLVAGNDDVRLGPVIAREREIGWAVRPANTELRRALNEYLIATRLISSRREQAPRDWAEIRKAGVLRMITSNNPASYFLWRGELMGFDYDLVREFARQHGLRVSVVVRDGPESMHQALAEGYGDVIAAAVTRTPERESRGWIFSRRYLVITEQLVGRAGSKPLTGVEELAGKRVAVNPEHSYHDTLQALRQQGINVTIVPVPNATSEMLVDAVAKGQYPYTLVDSHLVAMESTFRDDISVVLDLGEDKEVAWVVRDNQKDLLAQLNAFARKQYRGVFYNVTWRKYFAEPKSIGTYRGQRVEPGKPISDWDGLVRRKAEDRPHDWRLLIAQMYQESRFDPEARSHAGALGLMQVMPRTAAQFGYEDLFVPENNVAASLEFMDWLYERFPQSLPLEERIYFTLAAYNAGHAHVHDARRLAQRLGKDPNRWFGNVEEAMLLLSRPEYYRHARFGYVRGSEPVNYVREIRERYIGYLNARAGE
ncbi:MAG: transporter substrate-binding domain-containing protein [Alcanivoracaceae bacterium]